MGSVPTLGIPTERPGMCSLQLGWAPQPWLGDEGASWRDGHHSPEKSRKQGPLGYQMLPSAPGPSLASAGGAEGRGAGGPGVQLRGGQGAEKAQAGPAARVGCIWVSSVKEQHGGTTPSTPSNCLCPVAIRPWEGSHCRLSRLFVPTN